MYYSISQDIFAVATDNVLETFRHHHAVNCPYFHTWSLKSTEQLFSAPVTGQTRTMCNHLYLKENNKI